MTIFHFVFHKFWWKSLWYLHKWKNSKMNLSHFVFLVFIELNNFGFRYEYLFFYFYKSFFGCFLLVLIYLIYIFLKRSSPLFKCFFYHHFSIFFHLNQKLLLIISSFCTYKVTLKEWVCLFRYKVCNIEAISFNLVRRTKQHKFYLFWLTRFIIL